MNIVLHDSNCNWNAMEELWIAATLGAAVRHFGSKVGRVAVGVERAGSAAQSIDGYTCRIELETASGPVLIERIGSTRAEAFMRTADRVERTLFDRLFGTRVVKQASTPSVEKLAA